MPWTRRLGSLGLSRILEETLAWSRAQELGIDGRSGEMSREMSGSSSFAKPGVLGNAGVSGKRLAVTAVDPPMTETSPSTTLR